MYYSSHILDTSPLSNVLQMFFLPVWSLSSHMASVLGFVSKKPVPDPGSQRFFSCVFFFRMFTILGFTFICPLQVNFCSKMLFLIEK